MCKFSKDTKLKRMGILTFSKDTSQNLFSEKTFFFNYSGIKDDEFLFKLIHEPGFCKFLLRTETL